MEGRREGEHGDWERGRKKKRAGRKILKLNPKTLRRRRTEFLDMKERKRQTKAWGLGLKWFRRNYSKLYLQNPVWVVMDDNTPKKNAKKTNKKKLSRKLVSLSGRCSGASCDGAAAVHGAAQQNTSILNKSFHPLFSLQDLFIVK